MRSFEEEEQDAGSLDRITIVSNKFNLGSILLE